MHGVTPPKTKANQALLSAAIDKATFKELLDSSPSPCDLARLQAVSARNTSDWIVATPSTGQGLRLDGEEVQALVKTRLGLPPAAEGSMCALCPGKALDTVGHHALTCRRGPDVTHRHNLVRNTLFNTCRRALLNPILEQGAGLDETGSLTRPADILIPTWSMGKSGAIDVTIAHPLNHTFLDGASAASVDCLEAAELRKHQENDPKCAELGWQCLPIAATPYGSWGPESSKTLCRIAGRLAVQLKQKPAQARRELFVRLGLVLARCTARAIIARTPLPDDDGGS